MCFCVFFVLSVWVGYVHVGVRRKFPFRIVQISVALFLIARKNTRGGVCYSSDDLWSLFPSFSPSFTHSFIHSHMHSLWLIRIVLSLCMIPLLCVSSSSSSSSSSYFHPRPPPFFDFPHSAASRKPLSVPKSSSSACCIGIHDLFLPALFVHMHRRRLGSRGKH